MKKVFSGISFAIILLLLTACSLPGGQQPAGDPISDAQSATQVAQLLTQMAPTQAQPDAQASPTIALPTVAVEDGDVGGGIGPTATAEPATVTPEPSPTVEPTAAPPEATATTEPAPTATMTPLLPTATQPVSPTFTPPAGDPRQRLGPPTATDPMDGAFTFVWPTGRDDFSSGSFSGGSMAITALSDTDGWRMANPRGEALGNLYLEAIMRTGTCSGSDHYGLIVRVPDVHNPDQGYLYSFTCDGRYSLRRWNGKVGVDGEMNWLVNWTASPAIAAGSNQTNRISMFASGSRLILYANGTLLTEVQDSTFSSGYFGVLVGADQTDNLTVYVDEMSYWENPQP